MKKELVYSSAIKDMPLMYLETKRIAELLIAGKEKKEIIDLSINENILQLDKERRRKELPSKVFFRLDSLENDMIHIIATETDETARLIVLLSIIKTDKLFFEFMRDVYCDSFYKGYRILDDADFVSFLDAKARTDEKVSKWKDDNLKKIKGAYKKLLCDAGIGKKVGNSVEILPPIVDETIKNAIKSDDVYTKVMLLEVL